MIAKLVAEAHAAGARLSRACREIGVSRRTLERWRARPDLDDGRVGTRLRPHNALSATEQAQVVSIMTSGRFGHLSPKQLVPELADRGLYLASESTMYRLRRELGLTRHRPMSRTEVTRASKVHSATAPNQVWSWDISAPG